VGLIVVVGAWVVHGSLSTLLDSPTDRGWAWDAQVGDITSQDGAAAAAEALDDDPDVAGYAGQLGGVFVPIDGPPAPSAGLDPPGAVSGPVVLDGRAPAGADEIALGPQTLAGLHKQVGDTVTVGSPQGQMLQLHVVGRIVPMSAVDSLESFGEGALVPLATARQTSSPDQPLVPSDYLVTLRDGIDRGAALTRLENLFPRTVLTAPTPADLRRRHLGRGRVAAGRAGRPRRPAHDRNADPRHGHERPPPPTRLRRSSRRWVHGWPARECRRRHGRRRRPRGARHRRSPRA